MTDELFADDRPCPVSRKTSEVGGKKSSLFELRRISSG